MLQVLRLPNGSPLPTVRGVEAEVRRSGAGGLTLRYLAVARPGDLRLPPPAEPQRTDELWKHTCFEAFIRPDGAETYYELNFAPSTQWAAYRFDSYRRGMADAGAISPASILASANADRFELAVSLDLAAVPELAGRAWRVGVSAVTEAADGVLSYWALAHPPGRPDFHNADCFTLELAAPGDA